MTKKMFIVLSALFYEFFWFVEGCNEAVCGSIVTKCLLIEACNCDAHTLTCSKDCFICLGYMFMDCCSCVDMCPESSDFLDILSKKSHVEDFSEPVPELFQALTQYPDERNEWTTQVFPLNITVDKSETNQITLDVNCTVAFLNNCMNGKKCKSICLSMGSSSYRWFHDGCCECIGPSCINYGIKESRCKKCPSNDVDEDMLDENYLEYDIDDETNDMEDEEM